MVHLKGNRDGSSGWTTRLILPRGSRGRRARANLTEPLNSVLPAWDIAVGELAAVGLLAAERYRSLTGQGQLVEIALSDMAFVVTGHVGRVAEAQLGATSDAPRRDGNYLYGACGHDFVTRDERHVLVVALTTRQWTALVDVTGPHKQMAVIEDATGAELGSESGRCAHGGRTRGVEWLFPTPGSARTRAARGSIGRPTRSFKRRSGQRATRRSVASSGSPTTHSETGCAPMTPATTRCRSAS